MLLDHNIDHIINHNVDHIKKILNILGFIEFAFEVINELN